MNTIVQQIITKYPYPQHRVRTELQFGKEVLYLKQRMTKAEYDRNIKGKKGLFENGRIGNVQQGVIPIETVYKQYRDEYARKYPLSTVAREFERAGNFIPLPALTAENFLTRTGFATRKKNMALLSTIYDLDELPTVPKKYLPTNYFPKSNKRFQLHHIAPRHSYQVDLMFSDNLCYLIAININTRFLAVEPTNITFPPGSEAEVKKTRKSSKSVADALERLIDRTMITVYNIKTDSDLCFIGAEVSTFFYNQGITHLGVKSKGSTHTSLVIVDRVIRTLRDMHHRLWMYDNDNIHPTRIEPRVMKQLVNRYNNAPHDTFERILGFSVTPLQMNSDEKLETFFTTELCRLNNEIKNQWDWNLKPGTIVKILTFKEGLTKRRSKARPYYYEIVAARDGKYDIRQLDRSLTSIPDAKIETVSRFAIDTAFNPLR